jgi:signal transduction histidine kinase
MKVHAVSRRPMQISVECDETLTASFDVALVERVLHNLVGNAVRYGTKDGTIHITAARVDSQIELRVTNDGPPVREELRSRLFAKYGKDTSGRRGFGLYFCRLVCEAHGGTISHVPTPDGTTFLVRLPAN